MEMTSFFQNKTCLVTGGAGFIGSHLVTRLLELGAKVKVLDSLSTGRMSNIQYLLTNPNFTFVEGDVRNFDIVRSLVSSSDIVFHHAAAVVARSIEDPVSDMEINVRGTVNVLMAARESNVSRVIYASSASVYGNTKYLPMNEDDPVNPLSPYAVSKLAGENYSSVFFDDFDTPTVSLRYFNIYGPCQSDLFGYGGVVSIFAKSISAGKPPVVFGDGTQTRDLTEIRDAVGATLLAAMHDRAVGEVFNVGTGIEISINGLAESFAKLTGNSIQPEFSDKRAVDNVRRRVANIEKARRVLRYEPQVTLSQGLKRIIQYYSVPKQAAVR